MPTIDITVKNKIAESPQDHIVCGNSDYYIHFIFDDEWNEYETKTARFQYNGIVVDVVFTGDTCNAPTIRGATTCAVGVYAGDLHTTTPALLTCDKSILCDGGVPADPSPDVYAQIMEQLNAVGYNLGVKGATVGQIIKVSEVDDQGKPTAWEAADMPEAITDSQYDELTALIK